MAGRHGDISEEVLDRAFEVARRLRREQPDAGPWFWAEAAVLEVVGDRLGAVWGTVPPEAVPLFFELTRQIEARLQESSSE